MCPFQLDNNPTDETNPWSNATRGQLSNWLWVTSNDRWYNESEAYCHLLAELFPEALDKKKIKRSQEAEKMKINWMLLNQALENLNIDKKVEIKEWAWDRYDDPGILSFCRWFVDFYEKNKDITAEEEQKLRNSIHGQMNLGANQNQQPPSYRDYSQRCLPKEFVDMDKETFVVDRTRRNFCFLPTDVLIQICEKLPSSDFINLSMCCRFLRWRMYTFCKCYVSQPALVQFENVRIVRGRKYNGQLVDVYGYDEDPSNMNQDQVEYYAQQKGLRGLLLTQPAHFKNPFFFKELRVKLMFPYFNKNYYDKCLPYINALRRYAADLIIIFYVRGWLSNFIDYPSTNEFLEAIQATSYRAVEDDDLEDYSDCVTDIFPSCPYARKMNDVRVFLGYYEDTSPGNPYGYYENASFTVFIRTLQKFLRGPDQLIFHQYFYIDVDIEDTTAHRDSLEIIEYLFNRYDISIEYYSSKFGNVWYLNVATEETGQRHKIEIIRKFDLYMYDHISIAVGLEESFDEVKGRYADISFGHLQYNDTWWKMETAIEGESEPEEEESDEKEMETDEMDDAEPGAAPPPMPEFVEEEPQPPVPAIVVDVAQRPPPPVRRLPVARQPVPRQPPAVPGPVQRRPAPPLPPARAAAAARLSAGLPAYPRPSRPQ